MLWLILSKLGAKIPDHRLRQAAEVVAQPTRGSVLVQDGDRAYFAYRDHDRTPVIYCIKAMAERHYGVNVEVVHIHERQAFEDALLDGRCDTIIEHIEYLYSGGGRAAEK